MFCSGCGSKLQEGVAFCSGCGAKTGGGGIAVVAPPQTETLKVRDFRCNGCGSPLKIPPNSNAPVKCPSCKTECVIERAIKNAEIAAKENIESGISLSATPETLHKKLISFLSESPDIPLDVFEQLEVIREEHYCVPAYFFHCSGQESFNYEAGNDRSQVYTKDLGDRVETWERTTTEWTPSSGTASVTKSILAPGNRSMAKNTVKLYPNLNPKNLIDIEDLIFTADVQTLKSDIPLSAAFNEYAVPIVEVALREKAEKAISKQQTTGFTLGGANIQKETIRIFLGLYRIVYTYRSKEYEVWLSGDGANGFYEELPKCADRQKTIEQYKKEIEEKQQKVNFISDKDPYDSIAARIVLFDPFGWLPSWEDKTIIVVSLVLGILLFWTVIGAILAIIATIALIIGSGVKRENEKYDYQRKVAQKEVDKSKKELENYEASTATFAQNFRRRKQALRGIYQDVSDDASAF